MRLLNLNKMVSFYQELKLFYKTMVNFKNEFAILLKSKCILNTSNKVNEEPRKEDNIDDNELNDFYIKMNKEKLIDLKQRFIELYDIYNFLIINRWGVCECTICKESFESESQFNLHEKSETHKVNLKRVSNLGRGIMTGCTFSSDKEFLEMVVNQYKKFRPVIFLSLMEHNSNALAWRDTGAKIIYIGFNSNTNLKNKEGKVIIKGFDYNSLKEKLKYYKDNIIKIGSFTAASNITGEKLNVDVISLIIHEFGGFAFFDYATAAPYLKLDMNCLNNDNFEDSDTPLEYQISNLDEKQKKLCYKDAVFFSPHKFLGGPNTSGVLILKQNIVRTLLKPADTGGGIVLFVTQKSSR